MELNEETMQQYEERRYGFVGRWSKESAEAHVAKELGDARQQFTRNGVDLISPEGLENLNEKTRTKWDAAAFTDGIQIETAHDVLKALNEEHIELKKVLPPNVEPLVSRQEKQFEELTALIADEKFRARFADLTRTDTKAVYDGADETSQAGRRLVTWIEANFSTATFKADPDHDAIATMQMQKAIEARQLARVPKQLLDWRDRLQSAERSLGFSEIMRHLRSGRGIARQPKRMTIEVA